jgi:DNA-binding MarR family transcriptional regulator
MSNGMISPAQMLRATERFSQLGGRVTLMKIAAFLHIAGAGTIRRDILQKTLGISPPTMGEVLNSMEEAKLIRSERDVHDSRYINVILDHPGAHLWRTVQADIADSLK